jgi:hypothetical protein
MIPGVIFTLESDLSDLALGKGVAHRLIEARELEALGMGKYRFQSTSITASQEKGLRTRR